MKKCLLCPGRVRSKTDGDVHFISASNLARLYGVNMEECYIKSQTGGVDESRLIALHPQYSGNYTLPSNLLSNEE